LNIALKYYDQIDIAPILESFVIIARIATGLVLMNESELYTWNQLISICMTNFITIFGINIIAKKANFLEGKVINP
jgi:hypothetical protein